MEQETGVPYLDLDVGSTLTSEQLLADYDDGQFDSEAASEYESASEDNGMCPISASRGSPMAAEVPTAAVQADRDMLAMPRPATKLRGFPWHNTPRVASKDINNAQEEDDMPTLEDVTASEEYGISQRALEVADLEAAQREEFWASTPTSTLQET